MLYLLASFAPLRPLREVAPKLACIAWQAAV